MHLRKDPNIDANANHQLFILNNFRDYLAEELKNPNADRKQLEDALKVVNCLRFIKVNEVFIRYGFNHSQTDNSIYRYPEDKGKGVLRDFQDTAFHLNGYADVEKCITELQQSILQFENAFELVKAKGKLTEFVDKLRYNADVGCLAERMDPALAYAQQVAATKLDHFDDLMKKACSGLTNNLTDAQAFRKVFKALKLNIGEVCLQGKSNEIRLSRGMIITYMNNLGYYLPANAASYRTAKEALKLIRDEKALIKVIASPLVGGQSWNFIIEQLFDPGNVRPVKIRGGIDRTNIFNPSTRTWSKRIIKGAQGRPKPKRKFTKKEAASLLPANGKMHYFPLSLFLGEPIGLLFNIDECNLKDGKYIWKDNAFTNIRWWVGNNPGLLQYHKRAVKLEELRAYLRDCITRGIVPPHNEILAGLCKEALYAVFAAKDSPTDRLNALRIKYDLKATLGVDLPVLIIDPENKLEPREYSPEELAKDIEYVNSHYFRQYRKVCQTLDVTLSSLNLSTERLVHRYKSSSMGPYAIHNAVLTDDIEHVTELCMNNASVTLHDDNFQTAFELALAHTDKDIKTKLIKTMIKHAKLEPTPESMGHILEMLVESREKSWPFAFLHRYREEFTHNIHLQTIKKSVYESELAANGESGLAKMLLKLGADKPTDEVGLLKAVFDNAHKSILINWEHEPYEISLAKERFTNAISDLQHKIFSDFENNKLSLNDVKTITLNMEILSKKIATNDIALSDIVIFETNTDKYKTSFSWDVLLDGVKHAAFAILTAIIATTYLLIAASLVAPILPILSFFASYQSALLLGGASMVTLSGAAGVGFGLWKAHKADPIQCMASEARATVAARAG